MRDHSILRWRLVLANPTASDQEEEEEAGGRTHTINMHKLARSRAFLFVQHTRRPFKLAINTCEENRNPLLRSTRNGYLHVESISKIQIFRAEEQPAVQRLAPNPRIEW